MKRFIIKFLPSAILPLTLLASQACSAYLPESIQESSSRPPKTNTVENLFQGISYSREFHQQPRPLMVHIVTIDLTSEGITLFVTPGDETNGLELSAQTTADFLAEFGLQLAINGSFFTPFHSNGPDDYYPHAGDPVDIFGLAISNGATYSTGEDDAGVLCILPDNHTQINDKGCPDNTTQAIAGGTILLNEGVPITLEDVPGDGLHPRTAVAVDEYGQTLWLIIVDGRQSGYSEGIALVELAKGIQELGAYTALNLDGGGSTTLIIADDSSPRILNSPIHTRIPMRQRPVGNHLGVYARPLEP